MQTSLHLLIIRKVSARRPAPGNHHKPTPATCPTSPSTPSGTNTTTTNARPSIVFNVCYVMFTSSNHTSYLKIVPAVGPPPCHPCDIRN